VHSHDGSCRKSLSVFVAASYQNHVRSPGIYPNLAFMLQGRFFRSGAKEKSGITYIILHLLCACIQKIAVNICPDLLSWAAVRQVLPGVFDFGWVSGPKTREG